MGWLDGKVVLVVGGGSGIGRAVVEACIEEGASVCVLEINEAACSELEQLGPRVRCVQGDATSFEDNRRSVREAVESFGKLDILTTFVGVFDFNTHLKDLPEESLEEAFGEAFGTNVASYILSVKAALPELEKASGNIVLTVSTSGFYPARGGLLYAATKFAVRGLVMRLAHELAPTVRVNGVAPGGTLATKLRGLKALGLDGRSLQESPNRAEELRERTPLGLALEPKDHAGSYVFLASDRARGITGVIINSDGGVGVRP